MSARLLRPRSTGFHPEAQAWRNAVIANGGTVSGSTLTAVSNFCRSIDAAGIRDRFYRLNLFAGDSISAALVPLFRGQSRTGTQYGDGTDTNNNFVSGDFNNTGSSAGLKGNGSNKYLATGFAGNTLTASNTHLGLSVLATESGSGYKCAIGVFDGSNLAAIYIQRSDNNRAAGFGAGGASSAYAGDIVNGTPLAGGLIVAAYPTMYRNGTATGTSATQSNSITTTTAHAVFAINSNGTITQYSNARLAGYSIGLTMTASQAAAYNTAWSTFNTALSRT
jgi:hypothetical protein